MRLKTIASHVIAVVAAGCVFAQCHAADAPYPAKTVTIVVPFTAGGSADILSRGIARGLAEMWGRSVVVENRPGAASMIGAGYVANADPDGYRLLGATSSYPGAVATRIKLPFDPAAAFVPVAMIARAPFVLAVHPSVPARTVKEFIENWWGLFAPGKTPGSIVATINAAANKVLTSAEMKQLLDREGAAAAPMSVAQLADLLPKEIALYRKMAQAAGMKPE